MQLDRDYYLRPIHFEDSIFLREMLYEAIYTPPGTPRSDRSLLDIPALAKYVEHWGQPDDIGFLAINLPESTPIGAAWIRLFTQLNPGYGYLDDQIPELTIAINPRYRGQGIGTQLISHLFGAAAGRYGALSLSVDFANPALHLYQRLGFQIVGTCGTSLTLRRDFAAHAQP